MGYKAERQPQTQFGKILAAKTLLTVTFFTTLGTKLLRNRNHEHFVLDNI